MPDVIVPALGRQWLTGFYDPVLRLTTRERRFKSQLLDQLSPGPGERILDLASGTGTFALAVADRAPGVSLVGIDADAEVLRIAGRKQLGRDTTVPFVRGLSYRLPFATGTFDQVASSLFLHHLTTADKVRTLSEIVRVLRPGGRFHLADWTRGTDPVMRALSVSIRLLDGAETTQANFAGELPALLAGAGLENVRERTSLRTMYGTLALFSAERAS
jgi:ubiquinone/menaquinone biosynthesis C-methylase UbiE